MLYTVYMPWLARALQIRGFKIVRLKPNKNNPEVAVYQFVDSVALQEAIYEIVKERREKNHKQ